VAKAELFEAFARTGKALASGKRLEMLELLAQGERPVQRLAAVAGMNLTTASAHLQVLREAGLVVSRREGTSVLYRLAGDDVADLMATMMRVAEAHRPEARASKAAYLPDDLSLMDRAELLRRARAGQVLVLDVRPREEYAAGHLPGAVSIPLEELGDRIAEIPQDVEVVAYCRGRYCVLSHHAVRFLTDHGRAASLLDDGIVEWRADALPIAH